MTFSFQFKLTTAADMKGLCNWMRTKHKQNGKMRCARRKAKQRRCNTDKVKKKNERHRNNMNSLYNTIFLAP